jgi:excisionase family DNA binding protein
MSRTTSTTSTPSTPGRYLTSRQVAQQLHVSPKSVSRWAKEGRLPYRRTLGGHRRYDPAVIEALATELHVPAATTRR